MVSTAVEILCDAIVGYSEDTFSPQEYNITDYVKIGKNKLAVSVYRYTTGSYLGGSRYVENIRYFSQCVGNQQTKN